MSSPHPFHTSRRRFLASTAMGLVALAASGAKARTLFGTGLPWDAGAADPPERVLPGPWTVFTPREGELVEAIVERLIPADDLSVSGKDAGCAVFIDRQLAGHYGDSSRLYRLGPFQPGLPTQGDQSDLTPVARYRHGLKALDEHCRRTMAGKGFTDLTPDQKDALLTEMEKDAVAFDGPVGSGGFFSLILQNTMEGFFADPIYGGNRDMVSWRMIGFPGTRYDYRDHVLKHNQKYPLPPVAIGGRGDWAMATGR
ncbi:gluconate 2-dehydrogenase subunit 3 family protein [Azospirillum agricola]|uniref:gluconate 2-dehydrogenase subunit 3 family protein n=1 Tax=Azospirillum agricola TaxID=1720247 RepID=UPI000A0F0958|nr:gluconate 2-dehydrogenase subunit 3 family protein [Azospirillum agricola]SMH45825.1 gluconate 2-dehydrogenase gamma chain [Azospirillum lipoferum]